MRKSRVLRVVCALVIIRGIGAVAGCIWSEECGQLLLLAGGPGSVTECVDPSSFEVQPGEAHLQVGETIVLRSLYTRSISGLRIERVLPSPEVAVVWGSSNVSIATVSNSGIVTAVSQGVVRIQAITPPPGPSTPERREAPRAFATVTVVASSDAGVDVADGSADR